MDHRDSWRALHIADVHLGTPFARDQLPHSVGIELRASLRRDFRRLMAIARDQRVDAVTIGGDLFDGEYAQPELAEFLCEVFRDVAPIPVFIAPGERDSHGPHSLYRNTSWPENVTIFTHAAPHKVDMAWGVTLVGIALPAGRDRESWKSASLDPDRTNILLAHALDTDRETATRSSIYVLSAEAVRAAGYDLALLGHEHNGRVWPEDNPICVYPGSPQPLTASEGASTHSAVLVSVQNGDVSLDQIPINTWRYPVVTADLTGAASLREIVRRVDAELQRYREDAQNVVYTRVHLVGTPERDVRLATLEDQLDNRMHVRFEPHLTLRYDLEALAQERTVRGMLAEQTLERLRNSSDEEERAYEIHVSGLGLAALEGRTGGFDAL